MLWFTLQEPGVTQLLAQPPHDTKVGNASLCHYTWGAIYNDTTGEVWRWEKRDYTAPQLALKVGHKNSVRSAAELVDAHVASSVWLLPCRGIGVPQQPLMWLSAFCMQPQPLRCQ